MNPSTLDVGPEIDVDALVAQVKAIVGASPDGDAGTGALRAALAEQADFNRSVVEAVGTLVESLRGLAARQDALDRRLAEELDALRGHADRRLAERLDELRGDTDRRIAESQLAADRRLTEGLDGLRVRVLRAERALQARTAPEDGAAAPPAAGPADPPPFDYFLFEQRFRGPRAEIRRRQEVYLPEFVGRGRVLDLGCGRGEFVELLRDRGVMAEGIDGDEDMVDYCQDRGLPVARADLFDHLGRVPAASLDGVFAAQVIEHLRPDQLWRLVHLCAAAVKPGGVLVFETLNPTCPAAMTCFYLDPTHVRPVPPDLLRFMLEQAFFEVRVCRFTVPVPGCGGPNVLDVKAGEPLPDYSAYQDYGVVAVRSAHGPAAAPAGHVTHAAMNGTAGAAH